MLEERWEAARDWDAAVDQIHQIEGFEHFLRPVPFAELRAAAVGDPVVIVNISGHGSHALIVTRRQDPILNPRCGSWTCPPHPSIPSSTRRTSCSAPWLGLVTLTRSGRRRKSSPASPTRRSRSARGRGILVALEPVLAALGYTRTPQGRVEDWPRVWWCSTGPATVLPLHAAGRHPRTATQHAAMGEAAAVADTVAGRVISSYTPALTALARACARAEAPAECGSWPSGYLGPPGYAPGARLLPAVPSELQVLASYLPTPEHATHLIGQAATRQAVLEALPSYAWLRLSCHDVQHPVDAALSAFLLDDRPLTLAAWPPSTRTRPTWPTWRPARPPPATCGCWTKRSTWPGPCNWSATGMCWPPCGASPTPPPPS